MRTTVFLKVALSIPLMTACGTRQDFPESSLSIEKLNRALAFEVQNGKLTPMPHSLQK